MKQLIIDSIDQKQTLSFDYDGIARVVEPHAYGVSRAGNHVLRCYQTHGGHINPNHNRDLCDLRKIVNIKGTGDFFTAPRPGYKRGDSHMLQIFSEI